MYILLPFWEKVAAQRPDEGYCRSPSPGAPEAHMVRGAPPSPARGEGKIARLLAESSSYKPHPTTGIGQWAVTA